jgi:hypothetical protein
LYRSVLTCSARPSDAGVIYKYCTYRYFGVAAAECGIVLGIMRAGGYHVECHRPIEKARKSTSTYLLWPTCEPKDGQSSTPPSQLLWRLCCTLTHSVPGVKEADVCLKRPRCPADHLIQGIAGAFCSWLSLQPRANLVEPWANPS